MTEIKDVVAYVEDLQADETIPKNLRQKLNEFVDVLKSGEELSIKIDKILFDLEDICNDINIPSFVRTQLWSISSMLEAVNVNSKE